MLNIEVVAGGLMKLTMQVNSLLQVPVPHPPPLPPPLRASSLTLIGLSGGELQGWVWGGAGSVCLCSQVPTHGRFREGDPRSETPALTPSPSHHTRSPPCCISSIISSTVIRFPAFTSGQTAQRSFKAPLQSRNDVFIFSIWILVCTLLSFYWKKDYNATYSCTFYALLYALFSMPSIKKNWLQITVF